MRILIPGGTGLIGRPLAAQLTAAGHEVIVLSRHPERAKGMAQGVQVVGWDARTAAGWGQLADGAGAIVNLAGAGIGDGRWTAARKELIKSSRTEAGAAVTAAVTQAAVKPGVVVQAAGVGYYGPRGDELVTEEAASGHDFPAEVCRAWEASTAAVEEMGVRRLVLRTAPVLTTAGGVLPKMALPFKLFVGGPIGSGRQWLSWIHMADQLGAIQFLMDNRDAHGVFNLSAPNPLTNRDFGRALGRALGRPALVPTPAFAMKLVFGELSTVLLDGQRVVPTRLLAQGYEFRFATADAALRDLYGATT